MRLSNSVRTRRSISSTIGRHAFDAKAGGVFEVPIEVALSGVHRARVAAPHGDDEVGFQRVGVGQSLGNSWLGSRPRSSRSVTTEALSSVARVRPGGKSSTRPAA